MDPTHQQLFFNAIKDLFTACSSNSYKTRATSMEQLLTLLQIQFPTEPTLTELAHLVNQIKTKSISFSSMGRAYAKMGKKQVKPQPTSTPEQKDQLQRYGPIFSAQSNIPNRVSICAGCQKPIEPGMARFYIYNGEAWHALTSHCWPGEYKEQMRTNPNYNKWLAENGKVVYLFKSS